MPNPKKAIIRANPDQTLVEFETPECQDDETFGPVHFPEEGLTVVGTDPGETPYLAVLSDDWGTVKQGLYTLTRVDTTFEEVDDFGDEEEPDEEDDEDDIEEEDEDEDEDDPDEQENKK